MVDDAEVTTRRRGRPALGDQRRAVDLKVRVTTAERDEVAARARALGMTTTELIRGLLWPRVTSAPDATLPEQRRPHADDGDTQEPRPQRQHPAHEDAEPE